VRGGGRFVKQVGFKPEVKERDELSGESKQEEVKGEGKVQ